MNNYNKVIIISLFVFGAIFLAIGGTFAYFAATMSNNAIGGSTITFDAGITITPLQTGHLIPLDDNLLDDTLNSNNVCIEINNNKICSLYQITLTNRSDAITMTGDLITTSTTYTTNNLKYQLFTRSGNTYTAASDMKTVPITANGTSTFTLNNSSMSVNLSAGTTSSPSSTNYYLAIWLSDTSSNQPADIDKTYSGTVQFMSSDGGMISADFS